MHKWDHTAFKFGSRIGFDGDGGERTPENVFTDIWGNEKRDTMAHAIAFLEEVVK